MALVVNETDGGEERKLTSVTVKDLGYRDPLSDLTRKIRAQLMFASALAILVRIYQVEVKETPWLHFEIPARTPELLNGLLSVAVLYLFFVFWLYVYMDLKRWHLRGQLVVVQSSFDQLLHARNHLNAIEQHLPSLRQEGQFTSGIREAVDRATQAIPPLMDELLRLRDEHALLSRVQWFRLVVVEIGIPAVLGAVAISKTWPAAWPFVTSVFR